MSITTEDEYSGVQEQVYTCTWVIASSFVMLLDGPYIIGDFHNVSKFHAYSVNKMLFLTTVKLAGACPT